MDIHCAPFYEPKFSMNLSPSEDTNWGPSVQIYWPSATWATASTHVSQWWISWQTSFYCCNKRLKAPKKLNNKSWRQFLFCLSDKQFFAHSRKHEARCFEVLLCCYRRQNIHGNIDQSKLAFEFIGNMSRIVKNLQNKVYRHNLAATAS